MWLQLSRDHHHHKNIQPYDNNAGLQDVVRKGWFWLNDWFFFLPPAGGILLQDHCPCDSGAPGAGDRCSVDTKVDLYSFLIFLHLFSAWFSFVLGGGKKKIPLGCRWRVSFKGFSGGSGVRRWAALYILLRERWNQSRMNAARSEHQRAGYPCRNCTTVIAHAELCHAQRRRGEKSTKTIFHPGVASIPDTHPSKCGSVPLSPPPPPPGAPAQGPGVIWTKALYGGYRQR